MQNDKLTAHVEITIDAPVNRVWKALTDPEMISQYMFGTEVHSNWHEGDDITWQGEWNGHVYRDKGKIIQLVPEKKLQYTHYSPLSHLADSEENYHLVTIELSGNNNKTHLDLSQDNNLTADEKNHSQKNWELMLFDLRNMMEKAS